MNAHYPDIRSTGSRKQKPSKNIIKLRRQKTFKNKKRQKIFFYVLRSPTREGVKLSDLFVCSHKKK
jgi:hypothetical protein